MAAEPGPPLQIEAVATLPPEVARLAEEGQQDYERQHGVACAYTPFALIARHRAGAPSGVLSGYTAFAEIVVDDLWVAPAHRGRGIGRALLRAIEARFAGQGFANINLVTNAFQAVPFYEKCGFEAEFTRHNPVDPKLTKTFFVKWLAC